MLSTKPGRRVVLPCKAKLTSSGVTEQPPIRLALLQYELHSCAYLSCFVGSGLALGSKGSVGVECGADQGQMSKSLRNIPQSLAPVTGFLGVKPQVIGKA